MTRKRYEKNIGDRRPTEESGVWEQGNTRRGYRGLYERTVNQAEEGADFDFLTASGSAGVS